MCMWFRYNPQINFCHFCRILNLVIFQAGILPNGIDSGYLVRATPSFADLFETLQVLFSCSEGVHVVWI